MEVSPKKSSYSTGMPEPWMWFCSPADAVVIKQLRTYLGNFNSRPSSSTPAPMKPEPWMWFCSPADAILTKQLRRYFSSPPSSSASTAENDGKLLHWCAECSSILFYFFCYNTEFCCWVFIEIVFFLHSLFLYFSFNILLITIIR